MATMIFFNKRLDTQTALPGNKLNVKRRVAGIGACDDFRRLGFSVCAKRETCDLESRAVARFLSPWHEISVAIFSVRSLALCIICHEWLSPVHREQSS